MNYRMVLNIIGRIVMAEAALLCLPVIVALYYGETGSLHAFLAAATVALLFGALCVIISRTKNRNIYAGEGFVSVAFAWILLSVIGSLPFCISGEIPRFIDALFETVSGFTTTGASILNDIEGMSHSMLFWRSFTHWVGGMGVLVFVMAIVPGNSKGTMNIMRAEMPGPMIGKLVPRIKNTAKILYLIYIALTVLEIAFLLFGGMSLFESAIHALGTAGTGGFSSRADSIASYSPYIQWVITAFMLVFGINFNLFYLILIRRFRSVLQSSELWWYFGVVFASIAIITANIYSLYGSFSEALRQSSFQVSSIATTTGYATTNFDAWPQLSKGILFILMFIGGCAGSTAGGLKVSRIVLLFKLIGREIKKILHPRSVSKIHFEGRGLGEATTDSVSVYFAIYMVCFVAIFLLLCIEPFGLETNISATAACFNNVGPGFAGVGPTLNYSLYSDFSKVILSIAMLLGRLEIFPLIIALSPATWSRKYR